MSCDVVTDPAATFNFKAYEFFVSKSGAELNVITPVDELIEIALASAPDNE